MNIGSASIYPSYPGGSTLSSRREQDHSLADSSSPVAPASTTALPDKDGQEPLRKVAESQSAERLRQAREEQEIQAEIKTLSARDREVRAHEQAHMAVGGQYAGAAVYEFERGPNGVNYAVAGEVPISTSEEATPEATLRKAQIIRRAALAPAEPSPQDRQVAAMAMRMEVEARAEIARARQEKNPEEEEEVSETQSSSSESAAKTALAEAPETAPDLMSSGAVPQLHSRLFSTLANQRPGTLFSTHA
ncbi:catalase [Saccharophagus sp. K07]|jgi:hypothetical protein|uniref:putative metalloprotease CJM1_0395 family protein n=1 Tax=Saccharophagus sp. K07 TaxID=2283636 RepID=UPI0016521611|nr:putative metalloprotease CJM1_0395 family protein [Saccharophagus sp. K07]MBC6907226.1 catalase [Saccharophagus sp. K07]